MGILRRSGRQLESVLVAASLLLAISLSARAQVATQPATAAQSAPAPSRPHYETHASQQQIDNTIPDDKALIELLAPYTANLKDRMNAVIGFAPETIKKEGTAAGRLGLLISDIIRQSAASTTGRKLDMAMHNVHGLRSDEIPAGQITVDVIYRL